MKDAYYFSHDANARHDPKIVALCSEHGLIAYAYYFQLIEILREQDDYILNVKYMGVIATAWQSYGNAITQEKIGQIIETMKDLDLIQIEDGKIKSPSLIKRMEKMDVLRRKRSEAGKIGAMAKWQTDGKPMALKERKGKESKGKERKEEDISPPANPPPVTSRVEDVAVKYQKPKQDDDNKPTAKHLVNMWNDLAHPNMPRVRILSDRVAAMANSRLKEYPDVPFWKDAIERINKSPLHRGEVKGINGAKPWRASFEWLVNPNNIAKVVNGNYD
jgi:hypothetical protein